MRYTAWYVYRLYAANGLLLYVGKTYSTKDRFSQHALTQPWWDQVCIELTRVETYLTEASALTAERYAIKTEHPKYNKQHNQRFRLPTAVEHELKAPAHERAIVLPPPPNFYLIIARQHHEDGCRVRKIVSLLREDYPRYIPEIEAAAERYLESEQCQATSQRIAKQHAKEKREHARMQKWEEAQRALPTWQKYTRDIAGHIGGGRTVVEAVQILIERTGDEEGVRTACQFLMERDIPA